MTLSGADAPALPKGELYEWARYRLPFKKNRMKRCKKLPHRGSWQRRKAWLEMQMNQPEE